MKKTTISIGRPPLLRRTNALAILKLLREEGACSRADLVRASGMSAPTVTNVVADLLAAGLVQPLGEGESSGGRPPDLIRFKAERGCLLGVRITASFVSFILADLSGTELETSQVWLAGRKTNPEAICSLIDEETRRLLKVRAMKREQLMALVVGVPAIANVDDGVVLAVSTLDNWRSVPLGAMLRRCVECMVVIENDTNLAALGERLRGAARGEASFVALDIGTNVSAGIVLDGRLYHGAQWSAGEIGYLRLPHVTRRQPSLNEFGELEAILSTSGIRKSWQAAAPGLGSTPVPGIERVDVTAILDMAQRGEPAARKIVRQRAAIVADVIVNLALILNPGLVLLGGEVGRHPALLSFVRRELKQCEFAVPRIATAMLGEAAVLNGAIAVALEAIPSILLPLS
ncbi:MAG: ROK family transcriptional regulator [Bryobacteraceae bacterium]|nr:ROK family transcriptional regulator [Bryobacteraceae bacterium]